MGYEFIIGTDRKVITMKMALVAIKLNPSNNHQQHCRE